MMKTKVHSAFTGVSMVKCLVQLVSGILFLFPNHLPAQRGEMIVSVKKFTQNEGLSSYYVTKIFRDSKGFFWIGTQEGVSRFDGRVFENYTNRSDPRHRIAGSNITDIIEDRKRGLIWIVGAYGGVCAADINTGVITTRVTVDDKGKTFSTKWIRAAAIQANTLWIGINGGILAYDIDNKKFLPIKMDASLPATLNVASMESDRHGNIWAFCSDLGIVRIGADRTVTRAFTTVLYQYIQGKTKNLIFNNVKIKDNTLYAATSYGLFLLDIASQKRILGRTRSWADTTEVLSVAATSQSSMVISAQKGLFSYNMRTGQMNRYLDMEKGENNWFDLIQHSYYDSIDQKIWIGTQEGVGYFTEKGNAFRRFYQSSVSGTKLKHLYSLLAVNDSTVYCGDENGFFSVNTNTSEIRQLDDAKANLMLFRTQDGTIFLSNRNGFFTIENGVPVPAFRRFPCLLPLQHDRLHWGMQFNDSLVLFCSVILNGMYVWNTNRNSLEIYHKKSAKHPVKDIEVINSIYKSRSGKLFVLTEKAIVDLDLFSNNYTTSSEAEGFNTFMDMTETNDSYWFATYGNGLLETDKSLRLKRSYTVKTGISNDCVYKVFSIGDSLILLTTNNGLSAIRLKDRTIKNYYASDGLHSSSFEQVCGMYTNGKVLAGGVNGFTIIDPSALSTNAKPPVLYISKLHIETGSGTIDTTNFDMRSFHVPANYLRINILLSGLNYNNPERTVYEFRIDKGQWISLGKQNSLDLIGLGPATYKLEVRALNEDGIASAPVDLALIVLPKWYQTIWFQLLVALFTAGLIYAFFRYRINQIRARQQIRKDIAGDLHDDIGATLNSVKVFMHLIKRDPGKNEHVVQAEDSLSQATTGLRDMIWVLDDSEDTLAELLDRIRKFAVPVCAAQQIGFDTLMDQELHHRQLSKTEKRNLLLIAKECVNNSLKYADCSRITIEIQQHAGKLFVCISDDGKGFPVQQVKKGHGLDNIFYRAKQIRYTASIDSSPGNGTIITLKEK